MSGVCYSFTLTFTMGATCGARSIYPSGAPENTRVRFARSLLHEEDNVLSVLTLIYNSRS